MWEYYNPNPRARAVGDCTVRAISKALDMNWDTAYLHTAVQGFLEKDMSTANAVWGQFLYENGWRRKLIPDECSWCYTVEDFCREYPEGTYIVALSGHVVCVKDGVLYDSWDSSHEVPVYYWFKTKEE